MRSAGREDSDCRLANRCPYPRQERDLSTSPTSRLDVVSDGANAIIYNTDARRKFHVKIDIF